MTDVSALVPRATRLIEAAIAKGVMIATAESCTGGLIAGLLTEIAGSSAVVDRGFVTYSNSAKHDMLGVSEADLHDHGAVSGFVAAAMATGALAHSKAQIAVSVTGIAGPGGGSDVKPVGLVWFGLAVEGQEVITLERRFGDIGRDKVRAATVAQALTLLENAVGV